MTNLQEVPTEELLSFQDYPTVHTSGSNTTIPISQAQISVENVDGDFQNAPNMQRVNQSSDTNEEESSKSFWSMEYYQKFFDVDTAEVLDRILASVTPKWDNSLKHHVRAKPDLYGPFWISVTLVFTIAISSNIANYLTHANEIRHWRYDFHLVSYAATTIFLYVTIVPSILWGLLKWSIQVHSIEGLEEDMTPGALELICVYGYSLFIYVPVSILWSIQISLLQWVLVLLGTFISGSVLLLTLMPALRLSSHKFLLCIGIISCHLLLATGFKMYFFHDPSITVENNSPHWSVTNEAVTKAVQNLTVVANPIP